MKIRTVLGTIDQDDLGITQPHEHLLIDGSKAYSDWMYDNILYDESIAIEEILAFKAAGGQCIVDVTPIDMGRSPLGLQRISEATGVHIVMGTGWYREATYPFYVHEKSTNQLADMIIRDISQGADGTDVCAGIIGEIGTGKEFITPAEERVFRAAARAHLETGTPISTHTTHFGKLATEQLDLLEEEGVNLSRVIVGHLGDRRGIGHIVPAAKRGAFVQLDNIAWPYQREEERVANVKALISEGYLTQILLSLDICLTSQLHWYGGLGYDYLLKDFVPRLKQAGVTDRQLETILIENTKRALAF